MLLEAGADAGVRDKDGKTALAWAEESDDYADASAHAALPALLRVAGAPPSTPSTPQGTCRRSFYLKIINGAQQCLSPALTLLLKSRTFSRFRPCADCLRVGCIPLSPDWCLACLESACRK